MVSSYRLPPLILGLTTLAACGANAPPNPVPVEETEAASGPPRPLVVEETFFLPGERMTFELSLRGVVGGEATVAVGDPGVVDGEKILIIRSRTESTGVAAVIKEIRDEVTSWIELDSGLPVYHHADVKFGSKQAIIETYFNDGDPGSFNLHYERKGKGRRRVHQKMPSGQAAFNSHAILGAIRAWDGEPGSLCYFYVLASKRIWQNTLRMTGREKIKTELGRREAIRVDGVARRLRRSLKEDPRKDPREYTFWISDDEDRLPLLVVAKTEYGQVRAELIAYERPDLPAISRR